MCLAAARVPEGVSFSALSRTAAQFGQKTVDAVEDWQKLVESALDADELERLHMTNDYFNRRLKFRSDAQTWGLSDYWATPIESFSKGQGDCEDFVIAKYFTLRMTGVAAEKLRLIYVKAELDGRGESESVAHMVLAYYATPESDPIILDNLANALTLGSQRSDLTPIYSFNDEQEWIDESLSGSSAAHMSRWQRLLTKIRKEGVR